jgi:hypothetical protein
VVLLLLGKDFRERSLSHLSHLFLIT